jgi:hypothetical protein
MRDGKERGRREEGEGKTLAQHHNVLLIEGLKFDKTA